MPRDGSGYGSKPGHGAKPGQGVNPSGVPDGKLILTLVKVQIKSLEILCSVKNYRSSKLIEGSKAKETYYLSNLVQG